MTTQLKIAVDIDYTLNKYPDVFSLMIDAFKAAGHEVGIITARPNGEQVFTVTLLEAKGLGPFDFMIFNDDPNRSDIKGWKMKQMLENNINILFDDFGKKHTIEMVIQ